MNIFTAIIFLLIGFVGCKFLQVVLREYYTRKRNQELFDRIMLTPARKAMK